MTFDGTAAHADLNFRANTGQAKVEMSELKRVYQQTTGAMSTEALRAAVAQEKLDRAIARHGPESQAAAAATIAYRKELASLAAEQDAVAVSSRRSSSGLGLLSKAAGIASTTLIGGYGLVFAIKSVLDVSKAQDLALARTRNALATNGLSWHRYGDVIEGQSRRLEKASLFRQDVLLEQFSKVVRRTGNVGAAWATVTTGANLARAQNIPLEDAVKRLTLAESGRTRGLAQFLGKIPKVTAAEDKLRQTVVHATYAQTQQAKAEDLAATRAKVLAIVNRESAGAFAAYAKTEQGAQDRFNISLKNSEEIIGKALRPEIQRLLGEGAAYLDNLSKTGELQRDVNTAMRDTAGALHLVGKGLHGLQLLVNVFGGVQNAAKVLIAIKLSRWLNAVATSERLMGKAAVVAAAETNVAAGAESRLALAARGTSTAMYATAGAEAAAGNAAVIAGGKISGAAVFASRSIGFLSKALLGFTAVWAGVRALTGDQNMGFDFSSGEITAGDAHSRAGLPTSIAALLGDRSTPESRALARKGNAGILQRLRDSGVSDAAFKAALLHPLSGEDVPKSEAAKLLAAYHRTKATKPTDIGLGDLGSAGDSGGGGLTAAERAAHAKVGASAEKSAHAALIKRYSSPPLELQLREARILTMQAGAARDAKELQLLKLELKVQKERVELIKKRGQGKDTELAALKEEDKIQAKIDHLNSQRAAKGSQEQSFLDQLSGFRNEGSDIYHPGKGGRLLAGSRHVHNHKNVTVHLNVHDPGRSSFKMLRDARRASEAVLGG